jgi:hypothetical protein
VTRLSSRRLRVTMLLRVRVREATTINLAAFACRRSQTGGKFCAERSTETPSSAELTRGRRRVQRSVVVRYPARSRAACAQAAVAAMTRDGRVLPLLREGAAGQGRGVLGCPR